MESIKLDACPFCGSYGSEVKQSIYITVDNRCVKKYNVWCWDCGATSGTRISKKEAAEAWNKRKLMEIIYRLLNEIKHGKEKDSTIQIGRRIEYWRGAEEWVNKILEE